MAQAPASTVGMHTQAYAFPFPEEAVRSEPRLLSGAAVAAGCALCVGVPFLSVGPSFIVWPSPSEIGFFLLLVVAFVQKNRGRLPEWIGTSLALAYTYLVATAIISNIANDYPPEYSGWVLYRFAQWFVAIPLILFVLREHYLNRLAIGVAIGVALNVAAAISQIYGYTPVESLMAFTRLPEAGPWNSVLEIELAEYDVLAYGASGLFSFSRTATGFLLAMSLPILFSLSRTLQFRLVVLAAVVVGIVCTGSRLGAFSLALLLGIAFVWRLRAGGIIAIAMLGVVMAAPYIVEYFETSSIPILQRLVGAGEETFSDGIIGRQERQQVVFQLPLDELILGAGAGNLGFALGLHVEGFNLYGAHGFFFQYLGSVGAIGSVLMLAVGIFCIRTFEVNGLRAGTLAAVALCAVSDDLFFPSSQAGHLPLIVTLAYRMAASVPAWAPRGRDSYDERLVAAGRF